MGSRLAVDSTIAMQTSPSRLTSTQWLICIIAAIGFAFDTYELLMLPLIVGPAIVELVAQSPAPLDTRTGSARCSMPAIFGGIFGLLGGYLTDRFGRLQVLTREHPVLRVFRVRCRLRHEHPLAAGTARDDVRWRVRGVRGGDGLAGGAVQRSETTRARASVHSGLRICRGTSRDGGLRSRRCVGKQPAGDRGEPCGMALYAALGHHSGDPVDHHSPVPAESPIWREKRRRAH